MAAGVTVAAVVGAFVFFGPNGKVKNRLLNFDMSVAMTNFILGSSRLRQRRGQIAGLHNFGRTCFLNTLIQALASCPQFIAWLQLHNGFYSTDKKGLISSLLNTLEVVNGTHPTLRADPYSPGAIIRALSNIGWVIPMDEHDAHELFGVILSSLEEEVSKPQKIGCLSDALVPPTVGCSGQPPRPSSAMMTDFSSCELDEYNEASNFLRQVRSEAHTPDSPASICGEEHPQEANSLLVGGAINRPSRSPRNSETGTNESLSRRVSSSYRSLDRLTRGPGRVSVWSDKAPSQIPHPFQGALGNQIVCNSCGFKSTVKYDKFDSITLNLPQERRTGLSLGHLLTEYIASETIADVKCDSCEDTTHHTKSLTFAKLPSCLCIHISRTVWLPTGQICKRQDYVHFPESLSMAPYSFVQPHLNSQVSFSVF